VLGGFLCEDDVVFGQLKALELLPTHDAIVPADLHTNGVFCIGLDWDELGQCDLLNQLAFDALDLCLLFLVVDNGAACLLPLNDL
jgi:hypothetical protein